MPWIPARNMLTRVLEEHLNGAVPPDPNKFYVLLTNASSFTDISDIATIVQSEVLEQFGYARAQYNPSPGSYDVTQSRYEMPTVPTSFNAAGGGIQFDRAVLISNASAIANKTFTADASTNRLTVVAHSLVNGDKVVPTADAGGTLPSGLSNTIYYAKLIDTNTIELYTDSALTTIVDFTSNGSGTLRLRYANGNFELYQVYGSSTIPDGGTQTISWTWNIAGNGVDVSAA